VDKDVRGRPGARRNQSQREGTAYAWEYVKGTARNGRPDTVALEHVNQSFKGVKGSVGPVVDRIIVINTLCEKLGVDVTETPDRVFQATLAKEYPDITKAASLHSVTISLSRTIMSRDGSS
jgi:hypothetical protein